MHNEAIAMITMHLPAISGHGMTHMMAAMQRLMDASNPGMRHMMTGAHPAMTHMMTAR